MTPHTHTHLAFLSANATSSKVCRCCYCLKKHDGPLSVICSHSHGKPMVANCHDLNRKWQANFFMTLLNAKIMCKVKVDFRARATREHLTGDRKPFVREHNRTLSMAWKTIFAPDQIGRMENSRTMNSLNAAGCRLNERKITANYLLLRIYLPSISSHKSHKREFLLRKRIIFGNCVLWSIRLRVATIYSNRNERMASYSFISCKNNSIHYGSSFRMWWRETHGLVSVVLPMNSSYLFRSRGMVWHTQNVKVQTFKLNT